MQGAAPPRNQVHLILKSRLLLFCSTHKSPHPFFRRSDHFSRSESQHNVRAIALFLPPAPGLIKHESANRSPSLLNHCLWYDKLWGPSQRVGTLFFGQRKTGCTDWWKKLLKLIAKGEKDVWVILWRCLLNKWTKQMQHHKQALWKAEKKFSRPQS